MKFEKDEFYNILGNASKFSFRCWLGLHNWKRNGGLNIFSSNVKEHYFKCKRCGKRKTVYITKKDKDFATDVSIYKNNMKIHRWR
jgi:hypothetical protein